MSDEIDLAAIQALPPDPATPLHLCGWVDHPDRLAVAATFPTFAMAAAHLFQSTSSTTDILLYKAFKDALGKYPDYIAQAIGDCTSFGSGHALDLLQCIEMVLGHQPIGWLETCTEAIYGMGREIAGMLKSGDGCYGGAVSKALTTMGAVPRKDVGDYSGTRAKQWGRSGVPSEIKTTAANFKLNTAALVSTLDELDVALDNLYPAIVCSNQGFVMTRDSTGLCKPHGSWSHCMSIGGRRYRNSRRNYLIMQSWGDNVPDGPLIDDQPSFSFWIDEKVMASMLADKDSFAFSKFGGFEQRTPPASWTYSIAA